MKKTFHVILLYAFLLAVYLLLHAINENASHRRELMRDYQIKVDNDSVYIYDGERKVGNAPWSDGLIDSIILRDNY